MTLTEDRTTEESVSVDSLIDARVVFLTHYIPLYQVRVLQSLASSIRDFHVLLSTPIEPNRDFKPDWTGLDVRVQKTVTFRRKWRHREAGFDDPLFVHFPYDTTAQLRKLNPDVVMSLELGARSVGAARYCRRYPDTKLVLCTYMSERTEQGRGPLRQMVRRWLIDRADAITFNGPSCKKYLRQVGVPEPKLFPLPYAADDRTQYNGPVERVDATTRPRLLVVGQLSERKGVLPLIQQVAKYAVARKEQMIELVFAGDGPLRSAVEEHDVPANLLIKVLGNISPSDLAHEMKDCGCLIAATLADEWMLVVNEALNAGVPVIGSVHAQAVTTLIQDGVNGWRYDPTIAGDLDKSLDQYFECSAKLISKMRQASRDSVANRTPRWAASGALEAVRYVLNSNRTTDSETSKS
ncbi:glycosyltransferase family 4 protein [Rubripirellula reticaptiva]|uniref:Glycosyl transferases group 1 n=1 Tax=Rubripirellula reticaptiva TaxID=2528013 RepID=A0A5C6F6D4_9BACT|nr:glycosyltransferase family 4 protein [Rubripirellula reticaptiva]TWU56094.1 Glycosyl transferases group 1 [Rubripirellula reticaptiva]